MDWILLMYIFYWFACLLVGLRIIYDTNTVTKTLAYLMLVVFIPIIGIIIYFSVGVNYRKNKLYSKKIFLDKELEKTFLKQVQDYQKNTVSEMDHDSRYIPLVKMVFNSDMSPITRNNSVKLLINGEEKFPEVFEALKKAEKHIHLEYYIYEDDETGREIEQILIDKAHEGVEVRFIYDDFGSSSIRKKMVKRLAENGVKVFPFYKISFLFFANRINYRNHRKLIVIDGHTSFVGGINVSNKYSNIFPENEYFWRDTHLKIIGPASAVLQHIFIGDWNFCSGEKLSVTDHYFPLNLDFKEEKDQLVQIVSSGPDSDRPSIYYSIIKAISLAKESVFLTTPYFIPGESISDALVMTALSGVKVKLLVPGISDSYSVNAASKSYYRELLEAGVEIYLYQKGFIHAKTIVVDSKIAIVGTANLDHRSFDLNFEVNAMIYDSKVAQKLAANFEEDLSFSDQINYYEWINRPKHILFSEKLFRLVSPLL